MQQSFDVKVYGIDSFFYVYFSFIGGNHELCQEMSYKAHSDQIFFFKFEYKYGNFSRS